MCVCDIMYRVVKKDLFDEVALNRDVKEENK